MDAYGSAWIWIKADPVRLGFLIMVILTVAAALGYLAYHVS